MRFTRSENEEGFFRPRALPLWPREIRVCRKTVDCQEKSHGLEVCFDWSNLTHKSGILMMPFGLKANNASFQISEVLIENAKGLSCLLGNVCVE